MKKTINTYVIKALEEFDYNIEYAVEALGYALAYDEYDTIALTLMGRLYAERLFDYETAITYYRDALTERVNAFEVYEPYIQAMIKNENFKEAEVFINFAFTVRGVDRSLLYLYKAILDEHFYSYKHALSNIKKAEIHNYNSDFTHRIAEVKTRIKGKMSKKEKEKKNKKNKDKKEPKS